MSKKPVQSNTLFNYFSSPKGKGTPKKSLPSGKNEESKENTPTTTENKRVLNESSDDEKIQQTVKRRRCAAIIDSDSEEDTRNGTSKNAAKKRKAPASDDESSEQEDLDKSTKNLMTSFTFAKTNKEKPAIEESNGKPKATKDKTRKDESLDSGWIHENLDFLKPEKIRDAERRRPSDPNYDPKTLYVPPNYLDQLTPAMRQWWVLKSGNMDAVLFFKVGKFYELYHMDAVVGVQQLGFSYMKGEFAHSGFPESAYAKMATALIDKGFKVARVEQTETPELMAERCKNMKKATKFDKVVSREICQISTKASCVYGAQMPEARSEIGTYLYAVTAKVNADNTCRFGICFIETSIGIFHLSEFDDDRHCSKLLALFCEYSPGLILTERGLDYGPFKYLLNTQLKDVMQETLASKSQFTDASTTLQTLYSACYFKDGENAKVKWPKSLQEVADQCSPKPEYQLAIKALGGVHWFLKNSHLDIQLFSMGLFEKYEPIDVKTTAKHVERDYMVVDSTTIRNLNLLGGKGSLQSTLDYCKTPFGKRLLPLWICRPLCNIDKIISRQQAVKELLDNPHKLQTCQAILKKLPDLERQVAKIHTYGNKFCVSDHPDGRAVLYEAKTYSKRKIKDLLKTLKGFEEAREIANVFEDCESNLLKKLTQFQPRGLMVDLEEVLSRFKKAFDHEAAETQGTIIPKRGIDDDYDKAEKEIDEINRELLEYLKEQSSFFGCQVHYTGTDKKRFQLEVPESRAGRADEEYQLEGSRKGAKPVRKFSTPKSRELLQRMLKAEAERSRVILDLNRRIFEKFSQNYDQWQQVIHCLTSLDVLCAFAEYACAFSGDICLPDVEPYSAKPFIAIENGKHPCLSNMDNFVPNDTFMGCRDAAPLLLLTGPNMGGKSTLMRQVSVIVVMAQMGCFVPAIKCSSSLVDRVFTRLGAFDDIVRGQSTFLIELSEASTILKHASHQSLLVVDELGRGTSTHDGNAIATAYVRKLIEMQCRTLFSTHYHSLVDQFLDVPEAVQLGHMACMVENEENETEESVTLLYKLAKGHCPKSFGFSAAKLAGLPPQIVARGRQLSRQVEQEDGARFAFGKVFGGDLSLSEVTKLVKYLDV